MAKHPLKRAVPNERSQMVLEFSGPEYRLFEAVALYPRWPRLAFPQHFKQFTVAVDAIWWNAGGRVDADYLYENSEPQQPEDLEHEVLRLGYKNQAPSTEDAHHHVYGVYIAPFSSTPFRIGESIGGGIADRGGGRDVTTAELLAWVDWKHHFELSGCAWAIPLVESLATAADRLMDALIYEACKRNGLPEDA